VITVNGIAPAHVLKMPGWHHSNVQLININQAERGGSTMRHANGVLDNTTHKK
jgi:hypothetical protein